METNDSFDILDESLVFAKSVYDNYSEKPLYYHNWSHTTMALNASKEIMANEEGVSEQDKKNVQLAVVFHDVGFTGGHENHEQRSAQVARTFLSERNYAEEDIQQIESLIMATQMGYTPSNLLERIIQDSDLVHLGNVDYMTSTYRGLLDEINATREEPYTRKQWAEMSINFLENHRYHTAYAQEAFGEGKKQNLANIKKELAKTTKKKKPKKKTVKTKDAGKPERGVETMFRVALRNHVNLSRIADNKANTLISVNGIIISIVISALFPKMDSNPFLIYPGVSLISFSILTIIMAILSTIPKTTHGIVTRDEVNQKKGNLIFFGNFHKMSLEEFEWSIGELMQDKDYLYNSLTRDLYYLGKVLNRKYTLLRYSYYLFVTGLLVAITFFFLSMRSIGL
ncbi:MAG: phosphohydrolase [Bacteroidia bacterium]|nr:phosphohydrolase [Bacteroidia bacterium]